MATVNKGLGAIASPIDVRNYKAACVSNVQFPEEFELYRPPVKDQSIVSSCVAHALSSLVEYFNYIQEGGKYIQMSTAYIYGNRYGSTYTGEGMILSNALKNLKKFGDCPDAWFPGNYEVPTAITKFKEVAPQIPGDETYTNRISSYYVIIDEDSIKASLMENGIVIMATTWYKGTKCVNGILEFHPESGANGRHCMFIYGWNKTGWLVGNSWGRLWGHGGNCVIPFGTPLSEVWGIVDNVMSDDKRETYIEELKQKLKEAQNKYKEIQTELDSCLQTILELTARVDELTKQLAKMTDDKDDLAKHIDEIKAQLEQTQEELKKSFSESAEYKKIKEEYEAEIANYQAEIERLNTRLLEYEKPFHTKFGQLVAKVLNAILNLFNKKEV